MSNIETMPTRQTSKQLQTPTRQASKQLKTSTYRTSKQFQTSNIKTMSMRQTSKQLQTSNVKKTSNVNASKIETGFKLQHVKHRNNSVEIQSQHTMRANSATNRHLHPNGHKGENFHKNRANSHVILSHKIK